MESADVIQKLEEIKVDFEDGEVILAIAKISELNTRLKPVLDEFVGSRFYYVK